MAASDHLRKGVGVFLFLFLATRFVAATWPDSTIGRFAQNPTNPSQAESSQTEQGVADCNSDSSDIADWSTQDNCFDGLEPLLQSKFVEIRDRFESAAGEGVRLYIESGRRSMELQSSLYRFNRSSEEIEAMAQRLREDYGRADLAQILLDTDPVPNDGTGVVTNAGPGMSAHNWGLAFDAVPVVDGVKIWNDQNLWNLLGEAVRASGMWWGGDWPTFVDRPHVQELRTFPFEQYLASNASN